MSTVPEVVAAREEGLQALVLSLVTNAVVILDTYRDIQAEVEAEVRQRLISLAREHCGRAHSHYSICTSF